MENDPAHPIEAQFFDTNGNLSFSPDLIYLIQTLPKVEYLKFKKDSRLTIYDHALIQIYRLRATRRRSDKAYRQRKREKKANARANNILDQILNAIQSANPAPNDPDQNDQPTNSISVQDQQ